MKTKSKWFGHVSKEVHLRYATSDKGRISRKKTRDKFKNFIFEFLGKECVRCGFSDKRALHLDHIHGRNGEKRLGNVDSKYRFIRSNPELAKANYQILCANCNFIKMAENREYFYHGRNPVF